MFFKFRLKLAHSFTGGVGGLLSNRQLRGYWGGRIQLRPCVVLLDPVPRHTCPLVLCSKSIVCTLNWENNPSWVRSLLRKADKSFWYVLRSKTHHKGPRIVAVWFDWEGLASQSFMKCSQQAVCLVGPAYRMVLNALADFGVCMRVACCYLVFHPLHWHIHTHTHTCIFF